MLRSYKYRLYPTKKQEELINKSIGASRFIYNLALECKAMAYSSIGANLSCFDLIKQLPELKKEYGWLYEVSADVLQQSVINLDKAFTNFFRSHSNFPKFKKNIGSQSFRNPQVRNMVRINGSKIIIPKFSEGIQFVNDRIIIGKIRSTTITRTPTGKYFISVLVETGKQTPEPKTIRAKTAIGIDLGLKSFIVTSNGLTIGNPKHLKKSLAHIKYLQRQVSKKKKGGANRRKAVHKLAIGHERVTNQRKDFLHKLSTELIKNHDTICLEDLNISGMVKNHKLAQSISDVGWGMFVQLCKYKAEWYGKNFLQIPRFEPSTKICSNCGTTNHTLTLADREWVCANCGSIHDRDINAAINIKNYCLKNFSGELHRKKPVELPTIVGAVKQEVKTPALGSRLV